LILHYLNDILCKNYNYMFVFAKVIPKTLLVPFFSGHGVYSNQRCWLGGRKGIRPVKTERWDVGVVVWDEVQTCI